MRVFPQNFARICASKRARPTRGLSHAVQEDIRHNVSEYRKSTVRDTSVEMSSEQAQCPGSGVRVLRIQSEPPRSINLTPTPLAFSSFCRLSELILFTLEAIKHLHPIRQLSATPPQLDSLFSGQNEGLLVKVVLIVSLLSFVEIITAAVRYISSPALWKTWVRSCR